MEKAEPVIAPPAPIKKKPGRPKKKVITPQDDIRGIVEEPVNPNDVIEMVYSDPKLFKEILRVFKAYSVAEIEMNFGPTGTIWRAKDHHGKSTITASIEGASMNLYHCKQPICVCVKCDEISEIFATIGRTNYKISFVMKSNFRSVMYIIVRGEEYDSTDTHEIDVGFKAETKEDIIDNDDDYPLKFIVTSKYFKMRINNLRALSNVMAIQKTGGGPLQMTIGNRRKAGAGSRFSSAYNDEGKMKLVSTITEDDIFSVSVVIDYIKPFSNTNIGDEVQIAVDHERKMSFMTRLNPIEGKYAATIKIFIDIKK